MTQFNETVHLYKADVEDLDEPVWFVADGMCKKPLHKLYRKVVDELDYEPQRKGFDQIDDVRVDFYILNSEHVNEVISREKNYVKTMYQF